MYNTELTSWRQQQHMTRASALEYGGDSLIVKLWSQERVCVKGEPIKTPMYPVYVYVYV